MTPAVKSISCSTCNKSFTLTDVESALRNKMTPKFGDSAEPFPEPTRCPACRKQRRLAWRNERALYRRKCSATGKPLISYFPENALFPVYDISYWFSDAWDSRDFSLDYDFSKTFTENFAALQRITPRYSIQQQQPMVNSQYCNCASNCENSYFLFDSDFCRDSYYSNVLKHSNNCVDCSFTSRSELCYQTVDCMNCYNLAFSSHCLNCSDSIFLDDCIGCQECAMSTNLRNKRYFFRNQQLSREDYQMAIAPLRSGSREVLDKWQADFSQLQLATPHRHFHGYQNEDVEGDYITRSKNVINGYNIENCWDVYNCDFLYGAKNCIDVTSFGEGIESIYECTTAGLNSQNCAFCFTAVMGSSNCYYCDTVYSSKNCFGSISAHRREYAILNREYTPSEYAKTVKKIIAQMKEAGEWGEFFSPAISPFCYNETVAMDHFPLTKQEAIDGGYRWSALLHADKPAGSGQPPDKLDDVTNAVIEDRFCCSRCGHGYKIISQELTHYRKLSLPLPAHCPDCRHVERIWSQNPRQQFARNCSGCKAGISSSFGPMRPEKVLCERCYQGATI